MNIKLQHATMTGKDQRRIEKYKNFKYVEKQMSFATSVNEN